jgi:hypothetical protein
VNRNVTTVERQFCGSERLEMGDEGLDLFEVR